MYENNFNGMCESQGWCRKDNFTAESGRRDRTIEQEKSLYH